MKINSYGYILLFVIVVAFVGWVGGQAGFYNNEGVGVNTWDGTQVGAGSATFLFLSNLTLGQIEGMPLVFTVIWDIFYIFPIWIIYRQLRGID